MINKVFDIELDILSNNIKKTNIEIVQNDKNSNVFNITLFKDNKVVDLTTVTNQTITFKLSNSKVYVNQATVSSASEGKITYTLQADEMSRTGLVSATVEIYEGTDKRLTSCIFTFNVRAELNSGNGMISTNDFPTLTQLIDASLNEDARITQEESRQTSEIERELNETGRVSTESTRVTNESTRVIKETERLNAENIRLTNEIDRVSNEDDRLTSEVARQSNEIDRIDSENIRIASESERVIAEQLRETTTETIKTAYDNATKANLSVEVSNARTDNVNNVTYDNLGVRLDGVSSQLAHIAKEKRATSKRKAIITIEADDAKLEDYTVLLPFLNAKGVNATTAVPPGQVGDSGYMTWEQIHDLANNHNWSVESHTVNQVRLAEISLELAEQELKNSKEMIEAQGIRCDHISYPNGSYNDNIMELAKKYYKSAVTVTNGTNLMPVDSLALRRTSLKTVSLANIKVRIDSAIANNGWVIIYTHGVDFASDTTLQDKLSDVIDYALSVGTEFMNRDEAWDEIGNVIDIGLKGATDMSNNFVLSKRGEFAVNGFEGSAYVKEHSLVRTAPGNRSISAPITDFTEGKITYEQIDASGGTSYPEGKAGLLMTNYVVKYSGYPYQEYTILGTTRVYKRYWLTAGWSNFKLSQHTYEGIVSTGIYTGMTVNLTAVDIPTQPDNNYAVLVTPTWDAGNVYAYDITTTSFKLKWTNAPTQTSNLAFRLVR